MLHYRHNRFRALLANGEVREFQAPEFIGPYDLLKEFRSEALFLFLPKGREIFTRGVGSGINLDRTAGPAWIHLGADREPRAVPFEPTGEKQVYDWLRGLPAGALAA